MSEMTLLAQRCRDRLIQYSGEQHARLMSLGRPKNPDLYERVCAVLREEAKAANERRPDPTPESVYLALVDEIDGIKVNPAPAGDDDTIWYHDGQSYSMQGNDPIKVSATQHRVLQKFLNSKEALDTKDLKPVTENPTTTMKALAKQFPGAVRLPRKGHKGEGYFARVKSK